MSACGRFPLTPASGVNRTVRTSGGIFDVSLSSRGEGNGHVIASAVTQSHEEIAAPIGMYHTFKNFGLAKKGRLVINSTPQLSPQGRENPMCFLPLVLSFP